LVAVFEDAELGGHSSSLINVQRIKDLIALTRELKQEGQEDQIYDECNERGVDDPHQHQ